jgi:hypothetical protein
MLCCGAWKYVYTSGPTNTQEVSDDRLMPMPFCYSTSSCLVRPLKTRMYGVPVDPQDMHVEQVDIYDAIPVSNGPPPQSA